MHVRPCCAPRLKEGFTPIYIFWKTIMLNKIYQWQNIEHNRKHHVQPSSHWFHYAVRLMYNGSLCGHGCLYDLGMEICGVLYCLRCSGKDRDSRCVFRNHGSKAKCFGKDRWGTIGKREVGWDYYDVGSYWDVAFGIDGKGWQWKMEGCVYGMWCPKPLNFGDKDTDHFVELCNEILICSVLSCPTFIIFIFVCIDV